MAGTVVTDTSINISASNNFTSANLISINEVPIKFRHIFSNYIYFNRIQSGVFRDIFDKDDSLVVSAPTGSGKTVAFELAIVKLLHSLDMAGQDYNNHKIIYIAPMKALCEERLVDWHKKFSGVGVNCASVTGDSDNVSFQSLVNLNLIITTPEKWDSLTRRWKSNKRFVGKVALFMIDEVHLLNDESRGPTLEAIVSRMKTIQANKESGNNLNCSIKMRFLAVSATIPNVEDIAAWLETDGKPAKHYSFGDETRPVKLKKIVIGYHYSPQSSTEFKFDMMLSYKLQGIIMQHSQGKSTLIFCSTRKSVEMTAKHLTQNLTIQLNAGQKKILEDAASNITTAFIRTALVNGVACHHAGMLTDHRRTIEELFRNGDLPVIVTTSTLAMGVNLPAHLVIIKGTKYYSKGEYLDYDNGLILQMIGRAGRPQFDSSATAVILTKTTDKDKFENMVGGIQPIESSLHKHLTAHLNAEVVLRTITDLGVAMNWLTSTFLYVRAKKHPKHYGLPVGPTIEQLDRKLLEMCQIEINKLAKVGMVSLDQNVNLIPTAIGSLMAKYSIHFETMKLFKEVTGAEILQQILGLISRSHEFSDLYLRVNDKKTLNLLNKCKNRETIRYPLNGKIKTLDMKINCIIQAVFGCLQIVETSLLNEAQKIMRIGERVSKALAEYLESKQNCFKALLNAIILAKCFHARIWEDSPYISKQLEGIGIVLSGHLVAAGKTSFRALLEANPRHLEMIIHRKSPVGDDIQGQIKHLPIYHLALEETKISSTVSKVKVIINLLNPEQLEERTTLDPNSEMNLLIGDDYNNILKYEKYTHSYMVENPKVEHELENEFNSELTVKAYFISENWAGIDCNAYLDLFSSEKKKAIRSKTKKVVTKPKTGEVLEENLDALRNVINKKYIFDYFNFMKKTNKAQTKNLEAKALTEEEENQLIGNVTLDGENMNQVDEIRLLDSSLDCDIEAVNMDQAEREYNLKRGEMSDNLKKLLTTTTEEYLKIQKVLDETYDPSLHFEMTNAEKCITNDGNFKETTAKQLLSGTIQEYLETENATTALDIDNKNTPSSKMPNAQTNEATIEETPLDNTNITVPQFIGQQFQDSNESHKKSKYKFKQLHPSTSQNECGMLSNSTQDVESGRRSRNESSIKESDTSNGSAFSNPNDRKNQNGQLRNQPGEFSNSIISADKLQRNAALNEYLQHDAQPEVSSRLENSNTSRFQATHQVGDNNRVQVEPQTQASSNFASSNSGRLQSMHRNQVEIKNRFQVEQETQSSSNSGSLKAERYQDIHRNQLESKNRFQVEPQTQESTNVANSNTENVQALHRNQIETKNNFQIESRVSLDFANSNAEKVPTTYRSQFQAKNGFQTKAQTQLSSNLGKSYAERFQSTHRNKAGPQNQSNLTNSNAVRLQATSTNQVRSINQYQVEPQTFFGNSNGERLQATRGTQGETKLRFQFEPESKVSSNFENDNLGRVRATHRNQFEAQNRFKVEPQTQVFSNSGNSEAERFQAMPRDQVETKHHFKFEPQTQMTSNFANSNAEMFQAVQGGQVDGSNSNIFNIYNDGRPRGEFSNRREETFHNATNKGDFTDFCNPKVNFSTEDFWNASSSPQISYLDEPEDVTTYNWNAPNIQIQYKSCNSPIYTTSEINKNVSLPSQMKRNYNEGGWDSASSSSYRTAPEETNVFDTNKFEPGKKPLSMKSFPSLLNESDEAEAVSPCLPCYSPVTKAERQTKICEGLRKTFSKEPKKPFENNAAKHPIEPDSTNGGEYKCVEILSPKRPKLIEASDSSRKSIKWSSPLVTSPGIKYSPKLTNTRCSISTPSTSKREEFKAPKRSQLSNFSLKTPKNVVNFPITDKQCAYVSNSQNRITSVKDILSESFMEMLSSDVNPDKKPKQFFMQGLGSYTRSQILEKPSSVQKHDNVKKEVKSNQFAMPAKYNQNYPKQKDCFEMQSDFRDNSERNYASEAQRNYAADETQFLKNHLATPAGLLGTRSQASTRPQGFSRSSYPLGNQQSMFDPSDDRKFLKNRLLSPRSIRPQDFTNELPNFHDEFSAQPDFSRRPAFLEKPSEFYNQQDLFKGTTDFSGRHSNLPRRRSDFSRQHTDFPETRTDFSRRHTDFPETRTDFSRRHTDFPETRADFYERPTDFLERRADFYERPIDFSERPTAFSERHADFPERRRNFPERYAQRYADFPESRPEYQNFHGRPFSDGQPHLLQMHPDFERLDFSYQPNVATFSNNQPMRQNLMSPLAMDSRTSWETQGVYEDNFFMDRNPNYEKYNSENYQRFNN